jgi:hypothetical protein
MTGVSAGKDEGYSRGFVYCFAILKNSLIETMYLSSTWWALRCATHSHLALLAHTDSCIRLVDTWCITVVEERFWRVMLCFGIVKGSAIKDYPLMAEQNHPVNPRKARSSKMFWGGFRSQRTRTLSGSGLTPLLEMIIHRSPNLEHTFLLVGQEIHTL